MREIDLGGAIDHQQVSTKTLETELHGVLQSPQIEHAEKPHGRHKSDRGDQHHRSDQAAADVAENESCEKHPSDVHMAQEREKGNWFTLVGTRVRS